MNSPGDTLLLLHDTLSGEKRPLVLDQPGHCGVYCCGPTVYDMSHIGHARAAVLPDVLVRFLRSQGLQVRYVRNVTDIDDKIIARAAQAGIEPGALAERYTAEYHHDLDSMGMLTPDVEPRVTTHVPQILEMIACLVERDLAYASEGDVYFCVEAFPAYGALSKRDPDELRAGARVEVAAHKRAPADFALWKAAKPGEPSWDSPWGPGRPGWHIECSAMASEHLGESFEIHTGGQDLIFPHHENELAQSHGCYGPHSFARLWVHNGFVNFAGEKMSKSLGNFFTIRELAALYHPEVLRFFLLGVHYRSGINFDVQVTCPGCDAELPQADQEAGQCSACGHRADRERLRTRIRFPGLEEADDRLAYIYETLRSARELLAATPETDLDKPEAPLPESLADMEARVTMAMRDDLNTAAALAELSAPLAAINRLLASKKGVSKRQRRASIVHFVDAMGPIGAMLGLFERDPESYLQARRDLKALRLGLDTDRVDRLVAQRGEARLSKDWERADALRAELDELGVKVRDGRDATAWEL